MKNNGFYLIFAALLISSAAQSQNITLGMKGGFSIPNLTGGSSENPLNSGYSSRFGGDGGIYAEYHITRKFSVSMGFEYSSQGGLKNKFQAFPSGMQTNQYGYQPYFWADFKSEAKLDYVLLPILARYSWKANKRSPFKIYAALGPFAGYLIKANQVTSGSSLLYADEGKTMPLPYPEHSFDATTDIKEQLNTFNAGVCGFLGISVALNKMSSLSIEGGGNYGFKPIQKGSANGKNNTGAGVVTIGYAYTLQTRHKSGRR